jgi:hypothetical protein
MAIAASPRSPTGLREGFHARHPDLKAFEMAVSVTAIRN